jgi:hypothetical protein
MTVTLSWYVPPTWQHYSLLVQKQAGLFPELDLTILPTPGDCTTMKFAPYHIDSLMEQDMTITPPTLRLAPRSGNTGCYPQPGI